MYLNLEKEDTFSERLIFLFFHLALFLKHFKTSIRAKNLQELFDFIIRQIELSIREIGYGDVSVNKKMKEFINLLYLILEKIELWEKINTVSKLQLIEDYLNINKNSEYFVDYFEKYRIFLTKSTLNNFTKDILNFKF